MLVFIGLILSRLIELMINYAIIIIGIVSLISYLIMKIFKETISIKD